MWIQSDVFNILQDYGVRQGPKRKDIDKMKSSLPPQLLELMNMLFNIETYRCDFTVLFSGFACAHALFLVLEKNFTYYFVPGLLCWNSKLTCLRCPWVN